MHMPGFSEQAARFLVGERDICGVGVDTLSLDAGSAQKFVAHVAILGAGKYGVELMANLGRIPPSGATVIVGAPKHVGATGGPARVLALILPLPAQRRRGAEEVWRFSFGFWALSAFWRRSGRSSCHSPADFLSSSEDFALPLAGPAMLQ